MATQFRGNMLIPHGIQVSCDEIYPVIIHCLRIALYQFLKQIIYSLKGSQNCIFHCYVKWQSSGQCLHHNQLILFLKEIYNASLRELPTSNIIVLSLFISTMTEVTKYYQIMCACIGIKLFQLKLIWECFDYDGHLMFVYMPHGPIVYMG